MARLWTLLLLLPLTDAAWPSSCTQTSVDPHEPFGVGGQHDPYEEVVPNALVERGASGEYEAPSLRGIETELTSRVADPDEEDVFGVPKPPSMLGEAARQTIALDATRERDKTTEGAEMI